MLPFYSSVTKSTNSLLDRMNIDFLTTVSVKFARWVSLDYQLKVIRHPLLVKEFQIQNNLLITFGFTLIETEKEKEKEKEKE